MKLNRITLAAIALSISFTQMSVAQTSLDHSSQAIKHLGYAVAHGALGGAKLVSGIAATPFLAIEKAGQASGKVGNLLWDTSNKPIGVALPLADKTLTVSPNPAKVLSNSQQAR